MTTHTISVYDEKMVGENQPQQEQQQSEALQHQSQNDHYSPSVRSVNIPKLNDGACGFNISRTKWDPYPWASANRALEILPD